MANGSSQLAQEYLRDYVKKVEPVIEGFLVKKLSEVKRVAEAKSRVIGITEHLISSFGDFIQGGKKIRGALTCLGYEVVKGKTDMAVLRASASVEILNSALLMHDDFMDGDDLRRGRLTIHKLYEKFHQKWFKRGNAKHFGEAMAVDLGDLGIAMDFEILASAGIPAKLALRAIELHARILEKTAFGQAMDVTYELQDKIVEDDVLRVHTYKTAFYTVIGPLSLGAVMAGASEEILAAIEEYGKAVGVAFQLSDDELGLFSDQGVLGKRIGADVREGKKTILRIKALESANEADKKFLMKMYGNKELTAGDLEKVQQITKESGALDYSRKLGKKLAAQGKRVIPKITDSAKYQKLLESFAELMITRES